MASSFCAVLAQVLCDPFECDRHSDRERDWFCSGSASVLLVPAKREWLQVRCRCLVKSTPTPFGPPNLCALAARVVAAGAAAKLTGIFPTA